MKKCSKCKEEKEDSLFGKDARLKSGLRSACKACYTLTKVAWRANNQERYKENTKKYYQINKQYYINLANIQYKNFTPEQKAKKNGYCKKYYNEKSEEINLKLRMKRRNSSEEEKQIVSEKARIYYEKNKDKIIKRSYENFKNQTPEQKKIRCDITKKWRENNRHKARAWSTVQNAILRGDLEKPNFCQSCGVCNVRIHAHHEDYSLPLDITWLCHMCHMDLHAKKNKIKKET